VIGSDLFPVLGEQDQFPLRECRLEQDWFESASQSETQGLLSLAPEESSSVENAQKRLSGEFLPPGVHPTIHLLPE